MQSTIGPEEVSNLETSVSIDKSIKKPKDTTL
jgi:hypothetical protein